MELIIKSFDELTVYELYEILKARSRVFMLEQDIRCLDMDDADKVSLHCFFTENGSITAYLRAFFPDEKSAVLKIGRVLTTVRGKGLGRELMEKSAAALKSRTGCKSILVDAQKQAAGFYEKLGFKAVSEEFFEEGIPHIAMVLE